VRNIMDLRSNWQLFAIASAFFAALTAIFGKIGVNDINSNLATLIRTVFIVMIIAGLVSFRHEWQKLQTISSHTWLFLLLSACATGLSWLCYYRALQLGPVSKVAPIDKLSVAFAIVLSVVFLGEKLSWGVALGGLFIVSGSLIIILLG
jgi:transporter family protein